MRFRRGRGLGLILVCLCVAAAVLVLPLGIPSAYRALLWGLAEAEAGIGEVAAGDRLAEVEFSKIFASPPIVTATARTQLGALSFAVVETRRDGFRLELSEPAPTEISFSWNAAWTLQGEAEDMEDTGLPGEFQARTATGVTFPVRIEAYRGDRPAALLIPEAQLQSLDGKDEDLVQAALAGARKQFNDQFTCTWLDEVRHRLNLRVHRCPAWGSGATRERWTRIDSSLWSVVRGAKGLEIALNDAPEPQPSWDEVVQQWTDLLNGSVALDLLTHNNQVLDFIDSLVDEGSVRPETPLTVIHIDSHSDLWTHPASEPYVVKKDVGDFLNEAILAGRVAEVYWIAPDWTRDEPFVDLYWRQELPAEAAPFAAGPRALEIYVDRDAGAMYFGSPPAGRSNLPKVRFHKLLLRELPDLGNRNDIYLDIDGDYFSNTGMDTELQGRLNPTRGQMLQAFSKVADTLRRRGVKSRFVSWCLSPGYTAREDELDQERFFLEILKRLGAGDYLLGYAHSDHSGRLPRARNVRRQTPVQRFVLDLRYQDHVRSNGDRRIDLGGDGLERDLAVQLAARQLGLSKDQGLALLHMLDQFDGLTDLSVSLPDLEYFWAVAEPSMP